FGILVWSVLSGKQPYQGGPRALIQILIPQNQRPDLGLLPRPETLEKLEDLTALMQECWHNEPQERPTFAVCRDRTDEVFRYHRADVCDAVHRVGNVLRNQDTSGSVGGFSESMRDLSLRDSATDRVGELRTEYSTRPDPPTLPEPLPSLGTRPPAQEETPNNQSLGPKLSTTNSGSSQPDCGMARGPEVKDSQKGKPTNQKASAEVKVGGRKPSSAVVFSLGSHRQLPLTFFPSVFQMQVTGTTRL
ncbi:receptor-interacting serine/threonine-protein kinase 3-like, partial [Mustelus asterias]